MTLGEGPRPAPEQQTDARTGELDEFLSRAVDRQIAEQRSLREHIAALTEAVNALGRSAGQQIDLDDLVDRVRTASRTAVDPIVSEMRVLSDSVVELSERTAVRERAEAEDEGEGAETKALRGAVARVAADVEGIAQALLDLNAGLRDWAVGVDRNIRFIRRSIEGTALPDDDVADGELIEDGPSTRAIAVTSSEVQKRIQESVELSLYLADQIEDFDRVLKGMGDLPQKLEGVVSQGVRRTLAARAKLDAEAAEALDGAFASLDGYMDKMSDTVTRFAASEETLRELGEGQADLSARIDSLTDALAAVTGGAAASRRPRSTPKPKHPAPTKAASKSKATAKKTVSKPKPRKPRTRRNPTDDRAGD